MTERCHRCTRPVADCVCALLRPIHTRTRVTIVQHPGERRHAFNTARLLEQVVADCDRVVAWPDREGRMLATPTLHGRVAMLYPSDDATLLSADVDIDQLIVLDGTWSQARRLLRDNPWLAELPAVRLEPASPSRYRIREEPAPHCLSTIESTALALQALEPDNRDLDRILDGFLAMVDGHLAQQRAPRGRHKQKAFSLLDQLSDRSRAVVVYAESLGLHARGDTPALLQWTAVRLDDGALFDEVVTPPTETNPCVLAEMDLADAEGHSLDQLQARWSDFVRPDDIGFAWSPHTHHLVPLQGFAVHGLKAIARQRLGLVPGRMDALGEVPPLPVRGRAAARLAHAVAVIDALIADRHPDEM